MVKCEILEAWVSSARLDKEWFDSIRNGNDKRVAELLAEHPELLLITNAKLALIKRVNSSFCARNRNSRVTQSLATFDPSKGKTPLYIASKAGHDKIVKLLLTAKPDLINATPNGETPLQGAAKQGHEQAFSQLLIACPDSIDAVGPDGTILHSAVRSGNEKIVTRILALRPEMINAVDRDGYTAFRWAMRAGHEKVAEMLLDINPELAKSNILSLYGLYDTALHDAIGRCSDAFAVKVWRMNPQALHHASRHTAFHHAIHMGARRLIELFQEKLSLDEIAQSFQTMEVNDRAYEPVMWRYRALLLERLGPDVMEIACEYIGFGPIEKGKKKPSC